jgi:hypothetical protein
MQRLHVLLTGLNACATWLSPHRYPCADEMCNCPRGQHSWTAQDMFSRQVVGRFNAPKCGSCCCMRKAGVNVEKGVWGMGVR